MRKNNRSSNLKNTVHAKGRGDNPAEEEEEGGREGAEEDAGEITQQIRNAKHSEKENKKGNEEIRTVNEDAKEAPNS